MISLLLAFAAALQTAPLPEIKYEALEAGRFRYVVAAEFPLDQLDAIQAKMREMSSAKCGKLAVRWGKYTSDTAQTLAGDTRVRWSNYRQGFSCYDPATDPFQPVAADWLPSRQDEADARAFIQAYLVAMDGGDIAKVVAMLDPTLEMTAAEMAPYANGFRERAVPAGREIEPVRWARNPEMASHPGAYAFANVRGPRFCAYVMVYRAGPGRYQVARQDLLGVKPGDPFTAENEADLRKRCAEL